MAVSCDEFGNLATNGGGENTENNGNGENNGGENGENTGGNENGGNTGGNENGGNTGNQPSGDALTPDESRAKLEEIGQELIALANPNKQEELLYVIDMFYLYAENLYLEYNEVPAKAAGNILQPVRKIAKGNVQEIINMANAQNTYIYGIEGALGTYTHDGVEWAYTPSGSKLEFQFKAGGQNIKITIVPSGKTYTYDFEGVERDWVDYDPEIGNIYEETPFVATVNVPETVTATVTKGSATLLELELSGEYNVGGASPIKNNVTLKMGSYNFTSESNITTSAITNNTVFTIDGKTVLGFNSSLNGTFSLTPEHYDNEDAENFYEFAVVDELNVNLNILDLKLALKGEDAMDLEKTLRKLDESISQYESETELEPGSETPYSISQEFVGKQCAAINNAVSIEASYANGPVFAKIEMIAQFYEEMRYWDEYLYDADWDGDGIIDDTYTNAEERYFDGYEPAPVLVFEDDNARFSIADYFQEDYFTNVIEDFDKLMQLYENCLPNIIEDTQIEEYPSTGPADDGYYEEEYPY